MKKKLPVVTVAERDEASRLAQLPAEATVALQDLAASIKEYESPPTWWGFG